MKMFVWFPCWAHLIVCVLMLVVENWIAAWFTITTAYFAFLWISEREEK